MAPRLVLAVEPTAKFAVCDSTASTSSSRAAAGLFISAVKARSNFRQAASFAAALGAEARRVKAARPACITFSLGARFGSQTS